MKRQVIDVAAIARPPNGEPVPEVMDTERPERRIVGHHPPPDLLEVRGKIPIGLAVGVQERWPASAQHNRCIAARCPPGQRAGPVGLGADEPDLRTGVIHILPAKCHGLIFAYAGLFEQPEDGRDPRW